MIMFTGSIFFLQLLVGLVGFLCAGTNGMGSSDVIHCPKSEGIALQNLKRGFNNHSDLFSTWVVEVDCCKWRGVGCSNITGHVISLDLRRQTPMESLQDELSASLADLHYLSYLDLSLNDFRQSRVPDFIGSLNLLQYLNLSHANFRGTLPVHLGNLTHLQSLDLSGNGYSLRGNNLHWLHSLSSLEVLDLGGVDLSSAVDWLVSINMLPSLVNLNLFACNLNKLPQSLPSVNFTSLEILDLSLNNFHSSIPRWLFSISHSLVYLNLKRSKLLGSIPSAFGNMTSLSILDLSDNSLSGRLPTAFGSIQDFRRPSSSLRELYLSHNELNGSLKQSLVSRLSQLVVLDIASNYLTGVITEAKLLNFRDLRVLDLSFNSFVFNVSSSWIPSFRLDTIGLQSCQLGPRFPEWLRTQKDYSSIDVSRAGISGVVPDWFWNISMKVERMNLSSNQLRGKVPDFSSKLNLSAIDLSKNSFHGPLPRFLPHIRSLILAKNVFSGQLFHLCEILVANNSLNYLDLSRNRFSGPLPDCWKYGENVVFLSLTHNNLSGKIPYSIGYLDHLKDLRLNSNHFYGEVPPPMKNWKSLYLMDLGDNRLSGNIPAWIGQSTVNLMILRLSSNKFHGKIPLDMCQLKSLILLDLSSNALSGPIPRCINNFLTMAMSEAVHSYIYDPSTPYTKDLLDTLIKKYSFNSFSLGIFKVIDLSSNNLSGEIPGELTSLVGLSVLNLSSNNLTGSIPSDIGALKNLEALDLSMNGLSCSIPASATDLNFLAILNLSSNDLSWKIPIVGQFATFEADSYKGNPKLCGPPLTEDCLGDTTYAYVDPHCSNKENDESAQNKGDGFEVPSLYISVGLGFLTGFWVFWGTLLSKSSWRHAYFRLLDNMNDKVYVIITIHVAKLRRMIQSQQVPK